MSFSFAHLQERFPTQDAISRADLRTYLGISVSTDHRMKVCGEYPRTIGVHSSERILLIDLAAWLDAGGGAAPPPEKRRGRPRGSRNKPKLNRTPSPMLPAHMAAVIGGGCHE